MTFSDFSSDGSAFRPVGHPETLHENPWFKLERQPIDYIDPKTGLVRQAATEGGQMNYVRMLPGLQIVADVDSKGTILIPQERYVTNLVYGRPVLHYELPGGGIEAHETKHGVEFDEKAVITAAGREFGEETGYIAEEFEIAGSPRGLMTHSGMSTHHTITVVARGITKHEDGALPEASEIIGHPEIFSWDEAHDMYLDPAGSIGPDGLARVISSANTANSLNIAHRYILRRQAMGPTIIDLKK